MDHNQRELLIDVGQPGCIDLIVNADDYGYCRERSRGIRQLIEKGCVTSVSVMVNAPAIQQQVQQLRQVAEEIIYNQEKMSIGLHLNLTEFSPITPQINYPEQQLPENHLINPKTGYYLGKNEFYKIICDVLQEKITLMFITQEIKAQIDKFIHMFGIRPSHIDGHNHIHVIPGIAEKICEVASLYGIYSVRMPRPIKMAYDKPNEVLNQFNRLFVQNSQHSEKIYAQNGFIFPDYLIGLETMGSDLTIEAILSQIQLIAQKQQKKPTVVEIMVHPGYAQIESHPQFQPKRQPFPICPFSASKDRQLEFQSLSSQKFVDEIHKRSHIKLSTFHNLSTSPKQKQEHPILIYSKLLMGSGNLTTSLRLKKILQELGHHVYLLNCIKSSHQVKKMRQLIKQMRVKLIIGINLTNTAQTIFQALFQNEQICYRIPYMLMIAGTDANITFSQASPPKLAAINQSIKQCEMLLSLSEQMKQTTEKHLQKTMPGLRKRIMVIEQSICCERIREEQIKSSEAKIQLKNCKNYLIFPASFRRVKDLAHILPQLNKLNDFDVFLFGPVLDQLYYEEIMPRLGKVVYKGCIPYQEYLKYLRSAYALINTSQSEGMCCSIMEAFAQKIPVIARDNSGNRGLIGSDQANGFLYTDGEDFLKKFENLKQNYQKIKNQQCVHAYQALKDKFCYEREVEAYRQILQQGYWPHISFLPVKNENHLMMSLEGVHGISQINIRIFDKLFKSGFKSGAAHVEELIRSRGSSLKILDLGCGNGIFSLHFLLNLLKSQLIKPNKQLKVDLTLSDAVDKALSNCFTNFHEILPHFYRCPSLKFQKIRIIKSDMFTELQKNPEQFDLILANLPQTPFQNSSSRPDKNGGTDAIKYNRILIEEYQRYLRPHPSSFLLMLYSHMCQPNQFQQIVSSNNSQIVWCSPPQTHEISSKAYEEMETGLSSYLLQFQKQNKAAFLITQKNNQKIFHVPAELRLIKPTK